MAFDFTRPERNPDLRVRLTLLSTASGGPRRGLSQGCRIPHDLGLPGEFNDGMYEFVGLPPEPGASSEAVIWLLAPERNVGRLYLGFQYKIWDGRFIGSGEILEVINADLRQTSVDANQ